MVFHHLTESKPEDVPKTFALLLKQYLRLFADDRPEAVKEKLLLSYELDYLSIFLDERS